MTKRFSRGRIPGKKLDEYKAKSNQSERLNSQNYSFSLPKELKAVFEDLPGDRSKIVRGGLDLWIEKAYADKRIPEQTYHAWHFFRDKITNADFSGL